MNQEPQTEPHVINSLAFESPTVLKLELNRPAKMSNRKFARLIFEKLRNIENVG